MFHDHIITVLSAFSPLFSINVWNYAQTLLTGAILCNNQRTIAAILRVMGLSDEKHFINYYRVLNRARWSGLQASKILLGLLIKLIPESCPVIIGIDDTIERRKGKKIKAKGCYRDAVRSSQKYVVKCFGLKWLSMMLIVKLPWSDRYWSLPFLTALNPSESANKEANKRHKTTIDWSIQMMKLVVDPDGKHKPEAFFSTDTSQQHGIRSKRSLFLTFWLMLDVIYGKANTTSL